jgi:Zn-dependent protease
MELGPEQIRWIFTYVLVLIASVTFHEFGHAMMADRLGDDTPSRQGRLTLNPVAHADLIGTVLLPLMSAIYSTSTGGFGGFGWGRPVQTTPVRYTRRFSMATGQVFVALAGPMMNVLLALVISLAHVILVKQGVVRVDVLALKHGYFRGDPISEIFFFATSLNFTLFFFNLVPVPPLDGGWIVRRFVPTRYERSFNSFAVYGPFVIMAVAMIPLLSRIFTIPALFCMQGLYQGFAALFL